MKKTFFILPVAITLLFGFVSCDDNNNTDTVSIENTECIYLMLFTKDRHLQKYNNWLEKKPDNYSFTYYCGKDFNDSTICATVTVKDGTNTVNFFQGEFHETSNSVSIKSEDPSYKTPKPGDQYYITSIDDLFLKAENFYSDYENAINSGKKYFAVWFNSFYDNKCPFIDAIDFGLSEKDYRDYYGVDSLFQKQFIVNISEFHILNE